MTKTVKVHFHMWGGCSGGSFDLDCAPLGSPGKHPVTVVDQIMRRAKKGKSEKELEAQGAILYVSVPSDEDAVLNDEQVAFVREQFERFLGEYERNTARNN